MSGRSILDEDYRLKRWEFKVALLALEGEECIMFTNQATPDEVCKAEATEPALVVAELVEDGFEIKISTGAYAQRVRWRGRFREV